MGLDPKTGLGVVAYIFESLLSALRIVGSNLESDWACDRILNARKKPVLKTFSLRDIGYLLSLQRRFR